MSEPRFAGSRVRFDSLLNLAVLEMRASDTGEVTVRYPTESQIRAIQRASELNQRRETLVASPGDRMVQSDLPETVASVSTFNDMSSAFWSISQVNALSSAPFTGGGGSVDSSIASAGTGYEAQSIIV